MPSSEISQGLAKCPSCHTEDPSVTNLAISAGLDWQCSRCGSRWDAVRLATAAAYAAWVAEQTAVPTIVHQRIMNTGDVLAIRE